jgi:ribosome-binding protein aMBF1 (putative translation factor)
MSDESSVPWLRPAREAAGLSQQQLAEMMLVTHASISRWESGERHPNHWTRQELQRVLGVGVWEGNGVVVWMHEDEDA